MILTGDVGGTKTLLALHDDDGRIAVSAQYPSRQAPSLEALVARFLEEAAPATPRLACFGVAGPVLGDRVQVTHLPWEIDAARLAARFGIGRVHLLNDFAAAAHGVATLGPGDVVTLQAGEPIAGRPTVLLGAGTGLGLAYLHAQTVISGEAGHMAFAPADELQAELWQWLRRRHGRVQVEHVVSGRGLVAIHDFLAERSGAPAAEPPASDDRAAAIAQRALVDGEPLALAAVDLFLACYGALAGDHALAVLARGGVYLAGGIAPRLLPRVQQGGFIAAFNDKGPDSPWTRACPVHLVTNRDLPLLGAARYARQQVR
jgi:glucokinase